MNHTVAQRFSRFAPFSQGWSRTSLGLHSGGFWSSYSLVVPTASTPLSVSFLGFDYFSKFFHEDAYLPEVLSCWEHDSESLEARNLIVQEKNFQKFVPRKPERTFNSQNHQLDLQNEMELPRCSNFLAIFSYDELSFWDRWKQTFITSLWIWRTFSHTCGDQPTRPFLVIPVGSSNEQLLATWSSSAALLLCQWWCSR